MSGKRVASQAALYAFCIAVGANTDGRIRIQEEQGASVAFALHPRLSADTAAIADWPLSRVLLMNDKRFPWIVLVPRRADLFDITDLDEAARATLMGEVGRVAGKLKTWATDHGGCTRINVGVIGNIVPQLHIHVVARVKGDPAWPGVVWGAGQSVPYGAGELSKLVAEFRAFL
jgi:diadenosine tetraphosphate (Ap4A) HIT family hydrolase